MMVLNSRVDEGGLAVYFAQLNTVSGVSNFQGGVGDDSINGSNGNDTISGGLGRDTLNGGYGNDVLYAETAGYYSSSYPSNSDDLDKLNGGYGDDTLYGYHRDILEGGAGSDVYDVVTGHGSNHILISRGDGHDVIYGDPADHNFIQFGIDIGINELFFEQQDNDLVISVIGEDQSIKVVGYYLASGPKIGIKVAEGSIEANGQGFTASIVSLVSNDTSVSGGVSGQYNFVADAAIAAGLSDAEGANIWKKNDDIGGFTLGTDNAELIAVYDQNPVKIHFGGAGDDTMSGSSHHDRLFGDSGHDIVDGYAGWDVLVGGLGDDTIFGGAGDDQLFGGYGSDQLSGGSGDDLISGGSGIDTLDYTNASSSVVVNLIHNDWEYDTGQSISGRTAFDGDGGIDVLESVEHVIGSSNDDYINGPNGVFGYVDGGSGNDTLFGGDHADEIVGGIGDDYVIAMGGADTVWGGSGNDELIGSGGDDQLHGEGGADTLRGKGGNDFLSGGDGVDVLFGNEGNDELRGGAGNDVLLAGSGDDTLYTSDGRDVMRGEAGDDTFVFVNGSTTVDIIKGFSVGEDKLELSGMFGEDVLQTHQIVDLISIQEQNGDSLLLLDSEGSGNYVWIATLQSVVGITNLSDLLSS